MYTLNNLKLDIMLIPRHDNYFNRAKSNLKFLESSICEIPVVAQGFTSNDSPYQQNPEDSKYMEIAITEEDWITKTLALIEDKQKRIEMGQKAREYVLTNYNIKNNAYKWREAYQNIWNQKQKRK